MQAKAIIICGWLSVSGFFLLMIFQLALGFGAPLGHLSWGGTYHGKLPKKLRLASLFSVFIFGIGGLCVLEVTGHFYWINNPGLCRGVILFLAILFTLSTMGNLNSKSKSEKKIMTPVSIILALGCYLLFFLTG